MMAPRRGWAELFPTPTRRQKILAIALPIIGGMASQNVLNLVDTAMVGSLGDAALAATGLGSFANFMALAFILGLSTGVQAMAARRLGEGRESEMAVPLDGGLLMAFVFGVPLAAFLILFSPEIFAWLSDDPAVVKDGAPYLQVRLAALIGVGMNFSFRGYWSATHRTGLYLRTIVIMHALNIFLNWVLIFGHLGAPKLGVFGAGLATTISIYVGTAIYFVLAWKNARSQGFLSGLPSRQTMATMLRLSIPSSVQQFFFAAGMVALFWIIGRIGTAELAAANVLMTLTLVGVLPALGMGIGAATLIGNALGRKDVEDASLWAWNVATLSMVLIAVIAASLAIFHRPILGIFLHDPDTLELAVVPLLLTASMIWIDSFGMVFMNAHFGAGDSRRVMIISVVAQWVFFLPGAYLLGPIWGFGLTAVWVWQAIYRVAQTATFILSWRQGKWASIKV